MKLITLMTKVLLTSEEALMKQAKFGIEPTSDDVFWVWRESDMPAVEIKRTIKYDDKKKLTLIETYEGEQYLVREKLEDVREKWAAIMLDENDVPSGENEQTTTSSEEEDEDEE